MLIFAKHDSDEPELVSVEEARERIAELLRALAWAAQGLPGGFNVEGALGIADHRNLPSGERVRSHPQREVSRDSAPTMDGRQQRSEQPALSNIHPVDQNRSKPALYAKALSWLFRGARQFGA